MDAATIFVVYLASSLIHGLTNLNYGLLSVLLYCTSSYCVPRREIFEKTSISEVSEPEKSCLGISSNVYTQIMNSPTKTNGPYTFYIISIMYFTYLKRCMHYISWDQYRKNNFKGFRQFVSNLG